MRPTAWILGVGCASIAFSSLCGCSWVEIFPPNPPTLPNSVAVDRALRLCSLSEGDRPFHLVLDISPPAHSQPGFRGQETRAQEMRTQEMRAQVEIFWINSITYRTVIRSRNFNQARIVNGNAVEEHNTGDFYPRWIQNFVDAILDPVPQASKLRKIPGSVPIGVESHACISSPGLTPDDPPLAQVCFQNAEPRIASGLDPTRYVSFDDFAPFGRQQIARALVNDLAPNLLVRGQVILLEPLAQSDYALLKATELTPIEQRIQTTLVPKSTALSLLQSTTAQPSAASSTPAGEPIYIRTDRSGRVREAYRDNTSEYILPDASVARALNFKFKPLMIDGVPSQMEASLVLPSQ